MDYLVEAKKFVRRAVNAEHVDVIKENLKLADWFLIQEIEERSGGAGQDRPKKSFEATGGSD
jgi:hypothetical protein